MKKGMCLIASMSCRPVMWALSLVTSLALVGTAAACTQVVRHDEAVGEVTVANDMTADMLLTEWRDADGGVDGQFGGCPHLREVTLRFFPSMSGLSHVRNVSIDGQTYPAYGWDDASPLVIFSLLAGGTGSGARRRLPVSIEGATNALATTGGMSIIDNNDLNVALGYRLLSRGGPMTGGRLPRLQGTTRILTFPRAGIMNHGLTVSVTVPALPCVLSDAVLMLPDARSEDLARVGQTTATRPVHVSMKCPASGTHVRLTLDDANGSTGGAGELTPTGDSTATGVRMRLLRDGQPVTFGQAWEHGASQTGDNTISFSAQYIRTRDPLRPGMLRGEATLSADYR